MHFRLLVHKFLVGLVCTRELERIRNRRSALVHARDYVGTSVPVGFREVGGRPLRGMVGMGVIETDDVLAALAAFALNADEFPGIDLVAVVWRVRARVAAARDARNSLHVVVIEVPKQHAATLVGIGFLSVLTKGEVVRLRELEHGSRSE